jgi:hypothetical protein
MFCCTCGVCGIVRCVLVHVCLHLVCMLASASVPANAVGVAVLQVTTFMWPSIHAHLCTPTYAGDPQVLVGLKGTALM